MELEELEMISNKVKFGIVIIGLLGGLFLVLHYVIYPNLATGETRYLLWKSILETLFSSLSVAVILGGLLVWASPKKMKIGDLKYCSPIKSIIITANAGQTPMNGGMTGEADATLETSLCLA